MARFASTIADLVLIQVYMDIIKYSDVEMKETYEVIEEALKTTIS